MAYDIIPTVCAAIVAVFVIQGVTIYAVTKLVIVGRPLAERREQEPEAERVVRPRSW